MARRKSIDKNNLIKFLRVSPRNKEQILDKFKCSWRTIKQSLEEIKGQREVTLLKKDKSYFINTTPLITQKAYKSLITDDFVRIGIVSDTHLCSESERLDLLAKVYEYFKSEGVNEVYHSGDISDGFNVYRGHENFIRVWGTDKQARYVIQNYPSEEGLETFFITGNHDLKAMAKSGVDIGHLIVNGLTIDGEEINGRTDLKYLGQNKRRIVFPHGIKMDLLHPAGGGAYAKGYPVQKYLRGIKNENLPDVLIYGHLHQNMYMYDRNVHCLMAGAFQDETEFTMKRGLDTHLGGWLLEIKTSPRGIEKFTPNWISLE